MSQYLPVLLVSVTTNADDSAVTILPRAQVDYLSHNWREEDVWRSWRNMTRQKNEIANGVRLENASWRTWWKQRNKLKTVTPEELNWLKDSDVTWLYGPLHTDVDWTPPPKPPLPSSTTGNANSAHECLEFNTARKPILKHRSISELLTSDLPSPLFSPAESDNEEPVPLYTPEPVMPARKRPALLHTKSDTYITRWGPNRGFRKDSPPRVSPPDVSNPALSYSNSNLSSCSNANSTSGSTCSSVPSHGNLGPGSDNGRDPSPSSIVGVGTNAKKKHISFNTFVQQCIAIEKPKKTNSLSQPWHAIPDDDGYDEDEEDAYENSQRWNGHQPASDHDSDEDEDDVLEMCTPSSLKLKYRSKSKASSSSSSSLSPNPPHRRSSLRRTFSSEHATIAPIAPTTLKTTGADERFVWGDGFGDDYSDDNDGRWYQGERERADSEEGTPVELVYLPPLGTHFHMQEEPGSMYSPHKTSHDDAELGMDDAEDTLVLPPNAAAAASRAHTHARPAVVRGDREEFEAVYGCFGGPDLEGDFGIKPSSSRRRDEGTHDGVGRVEGNEGGRREMLRFAHGGAASVMTGRSSGRLPEPTLNEAVVEVRSRTRPRSRTGPDARTPSPAELPLAEARPIPVPVRPNSRSAPEGHPIPVPVPPRPGHERGRSASYSPPALLSPPARGRSGLPKSASAMALGGIGAGQERGRSSTRSSPSVSDRERERYEGGSPMGSLSPEGFGVGGLTATRYATGRVDRERDRERESGERGRERTARRVGGSRSYDDVLLATSGSGSRFGRGDSSTLTVTMNSAARPSGPETPGDRTKDDTPTAETQQEVEVHRSRNPTPGNSPVTDLFGKSPFSTTTPPVSPTTKTTPTTVTATPTSSLMRKVRSNTMSGALPALRGAGKQSTDQHLENGVLLARAVGIVSSAGAYFGLWHNSVS